MLAARRATEVSGLRCEEVGAPERMSPIAARGLTAGGGGVGAGAGGAFR